MNNGGIVNLLEKICLVSDLDGDLENARDKWPKNLFYPALWKRSALLTQGYISHYFDANSNTARSKGGVYRKRNRELKKPDCVAYPANISEISEILKIANCRRIPIIPFGGGSGVLGAANSEYGGIVVDMMRMDKFIAIDEMNLTAAFQTGILGYELERQLNSRGYSLGHFPASIAISTLGGWLATRSSGQCATKYGKIEDMVLGMKVILASGEVLDLKPKPGHSLGPDLMPLFLGSEGTLGVIAEATLKIMPLPRFRKFAAFGFSNLFDCLEACRKTVQSGVRPAVLRIYDPFDCLMNGPKEHNIGEEFGEEKNKRGLSAFGGKLKKFFAGVPNLTNSLISATEKIGIMNFLVVLVFEGNHKAQIDAEYKIAKNIFGYFGGKDKGMKPAKLWLKSRYKLSYEKLKNHFADGIFADTLDVSVSWSVAGDVYRSVKKAVKNNALVMAHFSHFSPQNLCIYFTFAGAFSDEFRGSEKHRKVWNAALDACLKAGGTISHHHGVGLAKKEYAEKQLGAGYIKTLRKFKAILDPNNILNPGKIF